MTAKEDGSCEIDTTALNDETGSYYRYCADYTYNGKTTSVSSEEIFVYIRLTDADQVPAPVFTGNFPSSDEYFVGATPQFATGVSASVSIGTRSFKWYVNYIDSYDGADELTELENKAQFKPDTSTPGVYYYFVAVTNTLQGYTNTVYTNTYKVTVKEQIAEGEYEGLKLKGKGTEDDPYLIETAEDYQTVYDSVIAENPLSFYGKYLKQINDITLPKDWKPIGNYDRRFSGTLDGNGKTITIPEGGLPLIGYIQGAEVKNLNIYGKKIAGYGLVNNFEGVGRGGSAIVIDNVTLKSGSSTLKSGLIGANITENMFAGVSNGFLATIRNCTIEEGVVIGYSKDQSKIGSIAGRMQGYVENCVSYATVYGKDYVGGIIGCRDNAMGDCHISGCNFYGSVEASGEHAGGIVGGGYENSTAPNGVRASVDNCSAAGTVTGEDKVGGIFGGDSYVACAWNAYTFTGNSFTGKVKATSGNYIGGIIGFYDSLNNKDGISGNYYSADCGASKGIGFVQYVDTNCKTHETESGAIYINTSEGVESMPAVAGCGWKADSNRTDDPLGADAEKLATTNANAAPVVTELTISGDYKKEYYMGQDFDFTGMAFTAKWSNQTVSHPTAEEMTVTGFDSSKAGTQEVSISYQGVSTTVTVKVRKSMNVTFSLLGDSAHDSDKDGTIHTLQMNNLETWVAETVYYYTDMDTTVQDVLEDAAKQYGFVIGSRSTQHGYYIESITWENQKLSELDNGKNSGWMYTVNGIHPDVGVAAKYVENGDVIIFHYTDDYTKEESMVYDRSQANETTETITSLQSADKLSISDKAAVQAARAAYEALTSEQKELVSAETLKLLEAAEARIAELEKSQHVCSWDAGTVTKKATCTETGIKTYKCACGKTRTETIEKAAHSYSKWTKASDATVFAAEVQKHTCSVCGTSETKNIGSKLKAVLEVPGKLTSISIKKGNTKSLNVTLANGDSVASVNSNAPKTLKATLEKNGKITLKALKKGSAKLTVKLASGKSRTYKVSVVTGTVKTTKLTVTSVTNNKLTLKKGKAHTLKSELKPFTSTQKVTYKTSNKKAATVTSSGKIKAVGAGKATITVTSGSKKVKVTVTVPGITGLKSSVTVKKNKTTTLKPKAYGISEKATYTSSNPKVATVTAAGKVKGIKKGTAKITVQAGSYKYTVTVKVK